MEHWSEDLAKLTGEWLAYIWFCFLAAWGGAVSYISRVRRGKIAFSIVEMVGECCISGFSGVMTAYICASADINFFLTAFFVGIAGHMGGRGIALMEQTAGERMARILGATPDREDKQP